MHLVDKVPAQLDILLDVLHNGLNATLNAFPRRRSQVRVFDVMQLLGNKMNGYSRVANDRK